MSKRFSKAPDEVLTNDDCIVYDYLLSVFKAEMTSIKEQLHILMMYHVYIVEFSLKPFPISLTYLHTLSCNISIETHLSM